MSSARDSGEAAPNLADIPPHIEETVQAIARLHANHHKRATPFQILVDKMTAIVARPAFIGGVTAVVTLWIVADFVSERVLGHALEPRGYGFPYLQGAGELVTIYITALVLMSQRRKDELSELREQLSLELATLTEQKVAKLIALTEEMRRDNPQLANRFDAQAAAMAHPADPEAVLEAFKEAHDGLIAGSDDGHGEGEG